MTGIVDSIFNFLFGPLIEAQEASDVVLFKDTSISASDYFKTHAINECMLHELPAQATTAQAPPAHAEPQMTAPSPKMVSDGFWLVPEHSFQAKPKAKEYEPYDPDYPLGFKDGYDDDWDKAYTGDLYPYEEVTFATDEYKLELPPQMMED